MRDAPAIQDDAIDRIIVAAELRPLASAETRCRADLRDLLEMAAYRAFEGRELSKERDIIPLLRAWKTHQRLRTAKAELRLRRFAIEASASRFGPVPWPLDADSKHEQSRQEEAFEAWLADVALSHEVSATILSDCISPGVAISALDRADRVAETRSRAGVRPLAGRRDLHAGGRPRRVDDDACAGALLTIFARLFGVAPTSSVRRRKLRTDADAPEDHAVSFVSAFEAEAAALAQGMRDPFRLRHPLQSAPRVRPRSVIAQHIERIAARTSPWRE